MAEMQATRALLKEVAPRLLAQKNVLATGVGYKVVNGQVSSEFSLVCSVERKLSKSDLSAKDQIPAEMNGVQTDVVQSGRFRALALPTERFRPAPGGVSVGHYEITAGTFGCLVRRGSELFMLSNNHVLANSNAAQVGDAILQPGPIDGGTLNNDQIAILEDFIPIVFPGGGSSCKLANAAGAVFNVTSGLLGSHARMQVITTRAVDNLVDAAIARPLNPDDVTADIFQIGAINGTAEGVLGMAVQKSGRTTGHTQDVIKQIDVTVNVQYGSQTATFSDQLLAGPMSQGGDSGSAILSDQKELVGLLFAGSGSSTIMNRIQNVFTLLNLSL
ncbi:MAG: hypothetical protein Q9O24_01325 [Gammaproteobacteria bacterium]|nr:hypothetical protein [Gammaproteobacteria bacterium]